jgi:hypothetical protein
MEDEMKAEQCQNAIEELTAMLEDNLSEEKFEIFVGKNSDCETALRDYFQIWNNLAKEVLPKPSAQMHARFYRTLNEIQLTEKRPSFWKVGVDRVNVWLDELSPGARWAFIAGIFIVGLTSGFFFSDRSSDTTNQSAGVVPDDNFLFTNFDLSQSATTRLREVQGVKNLNRPDEKIFQVLNQVLLNDPNINVRLSAIESLLFFASNPKVREYLIEAIPYQESPLVQLALADAMILLQEKRSTPKWHKLFESGQVEIDVKMHLQETLEPLLY